ncbi:glycosyltransferase [Candidatus Peregrinibacteria bacterium]|nr:glycosyltransferase [Candidatus Peregrinibacteria bacterium]
MFPEAPIYTSLYRKEGMEAFHDADIRTSFLQKIPGAVNHHQWYLMLLPYVFEQFNLDAYDIVISSSHACSKGIITKPTTLHVCYCHSPMRYVWDSWREYIDQYHFPSVLKPFIFWCLHDMRLWDRLAAQRVDKYMTNSEFVRGRIQKYYWSDAKVIYPPVDVDCFTPSKKYFSPSKEDYFLAVGRLVPYKRFDLLVDAFNISGLPLKICGTGSEMNRLKQCAKKNISFLGNVSDAELVILYSRCKAFLFPQCEDFGIAPLEAMSCGRPVIAYGKGGALETIVRNKTGIFFQEQTVESLLDALNRFSQMKFDATTIRKHALTFGPNHFEKAFLSALSRFWDDFAREKL